MREGSIQSNLQGASHEPLAPQATGQTRPSFPAKAAPFHRLGRDLIAGGTTPNGAGFPPMTRHPHFDRLDRIDGLAHQLDSAFRIPGTRIRLGYDSIIGLIPGIGDAAGFVPGAYIVYESRRMGAPNSLLARQIFNIGVDAIVGSVPLIGDVFDVGWKANRRNAALIREHVERTLPPEDIAKDVTPGDGRMASHHPSTRGRPTR